MKKLVIILLAVLILTLPAFAYTVPDDTIVYVTPTGAKYHREDCTHTGAVRSMTIKQAESAGYGPCSRCDPDMLTGEYVSNWDGKSGGSGSRASSPKNDTVTASTSSAFTLSEFLLGAAIPVSFFLLCFLPYWIREAIKKRRDAVEKQRRFEQEKKEYTELYGGKSAEELAGIPRGVEIGPDGLPKVSGNHGWGDSFTFYVTSSGRAYHRKYGCSGARLPEHAVNCSWRPPCRVCWPDLPDLSWYEKYLKIHAIKKKYDID